MTEQQARFIVGWSGKSESTQNERAFESPGNSKMVLPATERTESLARNCSVRKNATILLDRCKVFDSERKRDKGAASFADRISLRQKLKV